MIMARNEDGTYNQVGFVKDNVGIDTEYIYDKDGDIVFEKGFTRETSGTVPLTINGIGKDLKSWSITGNTVQTGTPTPDSQIMPQGTGERSAQLIPYPFYSSDGKYAGVQFTTDNGRIVANGTLTSGLLYYLWRPAIFQAGTYTMSVKGKHSGATIYFRDTTNSVSVAYIYGSQEGDRSVTFTVTEEISAMVYINAVSGSIDFDCTIMLNAGEEALPFEPTNGYKIPISSANTTTPVYLGEVETTRRIKKHEVKIERVITLGNGNNGGVTKRFSGEGAQEGYGLCDRALYSDISVVGGFYVNRLNAVFIGSSTDTLDDFKTKYNGASLWYILAAEETGIVNDPLMKIGDYADTLSMEQAGVQIPTNNGTTVIDVDTAVKPTEMYIKYKSSK